MDTLSFVLIAVSIVTIGLTWPINRAVVRWFAAAQKRRDEIHKAALAQFQAQHDEYQRQQMIIKIIEYMQPKNTQRKLLNKKSGSRYHMLPGCVYLLSVNNEFYKIGYAQDVAARVMHMQVSCPYLINIVHIIATENTLRLETLLHRTYESKHVQGEWFKLSADDVANICAIASPVTVADINRLEQSNGLSRQADDNIYRTSERAG